MIGRAATSTARLARRSFTVTPLAAASAVSLLNSLGLAAAYARLGGATAFGTYQIALALTTGLGVFAISGAATSATRAAAQGRSAAWPLFRMRLPYTLVTSGILVAGALVIAFTGNRSLAAAVAAGGATVPLFLGADVYPAQLLGEKRYVQYLVFQIAVQGLTLAAVVAALLAAPHRPWTAVVAMTATTGILQFAGLVSTRRRAQANATDLDYARKVTGVGVLGIVDARLDVLLTGVLLGAHDVGLLGVARMVANVVRRVWDVLNPPFFTALAATTPRGGLEFARRYRPVVMAVIGGPSLIGIVLAPVAIPYAFGSAFAGSVTVTQLLLASNIIAPIAFLEAVLLKAQGDLRRLSVSFVALPVVSLIAMPILVWSFGLNGVGIEANVAALAAVLIYLPLARRSVAARDRR